MSSYKMQYHIRFDFMQEAAKLLEADGGLVDGTRSEVKQVQEAIKASEEEKVETNGTTDDEESAKLKRKSTMQMTAEVLKDTLSLHMA